MTEVVELLVWPVTVVIAILLLRVPLSALLKTTKRVKYKDLEVEFNEEIQKISAEATKALPAPPDAKDVAEQRNVSIDLAELADIAPNAAVVESWRSLEAQAKALIKSRGHDLDYDVATPYKLIQNVLVRGKIIDKQSGRVFDDLRQLRNKVVHAKEVELSPDQSKEYVELSTKLRTYLAHLMGQAR